ncbi:MAG: cell division protein FtsL [Pseudohongiellaceae bacterium]
MRVRKLKNSKSDAAQKKLSPLAWLGMRKPGALRFLMLLMTVLGSGLTVVFVTHQDRMLFNELQQLKSNANSLQVEWGQLLIEQSTFGLEGRIENKAIERLNMRLPAVENIVMVRP